MSSCITKRLWVGLVVFFLFGIFALAIQPTAANVSQLDQQNDSGSGNILICTGSRMMQYFKPTLNRLDSVTINVADASGNLNVAIRTNASGSWQDVAAVSGQAAVEGWNVFDFEDVAVTPENNYVISVTGDCSTKWLYSISNPYPRGYAVWQSGDQMSWDYQFQTFGMSIATPDDNIPADTGEITTDQSATSETPGTASDVIGKPTNLSAKFVNQDLATRGVELTWDISKTDDIYGYKIYRSETATSGFTKIGQITKESFIYLDANILAGKTYYYQVRAYRDSDQSYSSNTASIKIPDDIGPSLPTNFKVADVTSDSIAVMWDKNQETNIAGYDLVLYRGDEQVDTATTDASITNYKFSSLEADTNYMISLVAKDDSGKTSPEAKIIQVTALGPQPMFSYSPWIAVMGAIDLILIAILIYSIISRRKKIASTNK